VRAARRRGLVGGVAVERVLADVEVEGREVDRAEVEELAEHALEVEGVVAAAHRAVELGEAVEHPALELGHLGGLDALGLVEMRQRAEQEAQGVAQAAVAVGGALEDLGADALVDGVVGLGDPEAQDVGAVLGDDVLGATVLPSDFDIFMPFSSRVKPWVSTAS
jgi:hypothetical protein